MSTDKDNNQKAILNVSYNKLVDGIETVFVGVIEMLRATKVSEAKKLLEEGEIAPQIAEKALQAMEKLNEIQTAEGAKTDESKDASDGSDDNNHDDYSDVSADDTDSAVNVTAKEAPMQEHEKSASSITADDITKVIVRKIKQDRSNSEKIGSILKTYGIAKVSELPEEKYEAFLTDLSAL